MTENTMSIHIDLVGQKIGQEDAVALINRFLSLNAREQRRRRMLYQRLG
jgi:hypothetical protein